MAIDPVIVSTSQAAGAIVFGATALGKLTAPGQFARALDGYGLVPRLLVAPLAVGLALLELMVAAGLPLEATRKPAAIIGLVLLAVFFAAIAISLARGNRDIDCGCWAFGRRDPQAPARLSGWHLGRVALLAALLAPCLLESTSRSVLWVDYLTVAGSLAVTGGLFFVIDVLLANGAMAQKLKA
ncbi:MauE/DoxX family redox-associated membrane protein [Cupriavidus sp. IDO]|uniref:MauE/DoxX family redox-associated membrane protein n=1 Tax=Cupriavidus sp. IDO TaxID=1539142 RepID=UPI0005790FD6|nr:MauE/DoxX family redox-associated membrane protein [Cupriavidus sp. IDO]KWR87997.1 hypothetical protein RM96_22070 [Cupriavidus sp. IDO]